MAQSGKPVIEVMAYFIHGKCSIYMVVIKIYLETGEIVAIKKFKDSEDNDDVKRTTMRKELNTFDVPDAPVSSGNPALSWEYSL